MKVKITCFQLLFVQVLIIQMFFSPSILSQSKNEFKKVRALVIGVSNYVNIKGLQYADTDALEFCDYLRSSTGFSSNSESMEIKLLINEEVTFINIKSALDTLIKTSKKNDLVIIYFSGHGDVATMFNEKVGFLLTYDTSYPNYFERSFRVDDLKKGISAIVQKEATVILIVDACRSGVLTGGIEGVTFTTTELLKNWDKSVKILSTTPGLLSYEDTKTKSGYFTYYLLRGLRGEADEDKNKKVSLSELGSYLVKNVPPVTNDRQRPIVDGNDYTILTTVDTLFLASLNNKEKEQKFEKRAAIKGQQSSLSELDSITKKLIYNFNLSLKNGFLISSPDSIESAWEIYNKLKDRNDMIVTITEMKSNLINSLQNNSQLIINAFVKGKTEEADHVDLNQAYQEILLADSLIDENSMFYNEIRVKSLFMESLFYSESEYEKRINLLEECTILQPDDAFSFCELGRAYHDAQKYDEAKANYYKAIQLAPRWKYPYYNIAIVYTDLEQNEMAIRNYNQAIEIDPNYTDAYNNLGIIYFNNADDLKAIEYYSKAVDINPEYKLAYYNLGLVYYDIGDSEKALYNYNKTIELDSNYVNAYDKAGIIYYQLKDYKSGINIYNKYIEFYPDDAYGYQMRGLCYFYGSNYERSLVDLQKVVKLSPEYSGGYYNLACYYSVTNNVEESLTNLDKALQLGYSDFSHIAEDQDLDNIRSHPGYTSLIKQYKK